MIKHRYLSRSAMVSWQRCERLGFWGNIYGGLGISPIKKSSALAIGSAEHAGVESLLRGLQAGTVSEQAAIDAALKTYEDETASGLAGIPDRFQFQVRREHRALIEVGVKLYAAYRLPMIQEKYEIVEVETEHTIRLTPDLTLVSRPDGVFADKFSGWFDVLSLKTAGRYDYRKQKDPTVDMQGLSESYAVAHDYPGAYINGVMMEYIVTGKEEETDPEDGTRDLYPIRRTPLVRGWIRRMGDGIGPGTYEIAWRYKYDNPNFDPTKPRKTGNFKQTSLSTKQGWTPVVAYDHPGGLDGWVQDITSGLMIPRHASATSEIFQYPPPYIRKQEHIDDWVESTIYHQTEISKKIAGYESGELTINQAFEQRTHSCMYPQKCPFYEICWKGRSPDDTRHYVPRTPHHEQETLEPPED